MVRVRRHAQGAILWSAKAPLLHLVGACCRARGRAVGRLHASARLCEQRLELGNLLSLGAILPARGRGGEHRQAELESEAAAGAGRLRLGLGRDEERAASTGGATRASASAHPRMKAKAESSAGTQDGQRRG